MRFTIENNCICSSKIVDIRIYLEKTNQTKKLVRFISENNNPHNQEKARVFLINKNQIRLNGFNKR